MVSKTITVKHRPILDMIPASSLVKMALSFTSTCTIIAHDRTFDCKSIVALMTANLKYGTEIEIACEGSDEEAALKAISEFFETGANF